MSGVPDLDVQSALPAFLASRPWAVRLIHILRWLFPVVLLGYVGYRLSELGWRDMWAARPGNFGFYVMLVVQFFLQPLGDFMVYRNLWGAQNAPPLAVILRKRFLNSAMLDYSGEVFFYFWAQARLMLPPGMLIHAIKDSNVLSAGAGLIDGAALIARDLAAAERTPDAVQDLRSRFAHAARLFFHCAWNVPPAGGAGRSRKRVQPPARGIAR